MTNRAGHVNELAPIRPADVIPEGIADLPSNAPVIAVVVSLNFPDMTAEVSELVKRFTRTALETLLRAGARPALVDSSATNLPDTEHVAAAAGVLFLGGGDVDPGLYGVPGRVVPNLYGVDRRADEYCMELIDLTLARDAPLLAICRGSQLLNLTCGGSLIPDLDPYHLHRGGKGESMFLDEPVTLLAGRLRRILGKDRITVRSGHHQAVEQVAPFLRIAALADDGIVEATEHTENTWVIGVQWHPEDSDGNAKDRELLFESFVDQTRIYAETHHRHPLASAGGSK
jgi:putative glutamine amidotransferase